MTTIPQPGVWNVAYTLIYDAWNRLVEVKNATPATIETYEYDGLNRRIERDDESNVYDYYHNQGTQGNSGVRPAIGIKA